MVTVAAERKTFPYGSYSHMTPEGNGRAQKYYQKQKAVTKAVTKTLAVQTGMAFQDTARNLRNKVDDLGNKLFSVSANVCETEWAMNESYAGPGYPASNTQKFYSPEWVKDVASAVKDVNAALKDVERGVTATQKAGDSHNRALAAYNEASLQADQSKKGKATTGLNDVQSKAVERPSTLGQKVKNKLAALKSDGK